MPTDYLHTNAFEVIFWLVALSGVVAGSALYRDALLDRRYQRIENERANRVNGDRMRVAEQAVRARRSELFIHLLLVVVWTAILFADDAHPDGAPLPNVMAGIALLGVTAETLRKALEERIAVKDHIALLAERARHNGGK